MSYRHARQCLRVAHKSIQQSTFVGGLVFLSLLFVFARLQLNIIAAFETQLRSLMAPQRELSLHYEARGELRALAASALVTRIDETSVVISKLRNIIDKGS